MIQITLKKLIGVTISVVASAATLAGLAAGRSSARDTAMPKHNMSQSGADSPILVELFTSEGCSSCPPADTLLQELQKSQPVSGAHIIALSEHVDYWNHLGWKDPYSSAVYSSRQSAYAQSFKKSQVYTPQMVVDGQTEFVGSDRSAAQSAIARAAKQPKAKITLARTGDAFSVSVSVLPEGTAVADVYAGVAENNIASSVQRGENSGRRLTHTAVARQLVRIGTISAGKPFEGSFHPKATGSKKDKRVFAFVQETETRRVVGVSEAPIGS